MTKDKSNVVWKPYWIDGFAMHSFGDMCVNTVSSRTIYKGAGKLQKTFWESQVVASIIDSNVNVFAF